MALAILRRMTKAGEQSNGAMDLLTEKVAAAL